LGLLLAADVAYGRRRLLPYMATLLAASLVGRLSATPDVLKYLSTFLAFFALAWVLWTRLRSREHVAVIAAGAVIGAAAGLASGSSVGRQVAWTGAQLLASVAVGHAYLKPIRLAITTPKAADLSLLAFAAFDWSVGLAAGAEVLGADIALGEIWAEIVWIQAALFVTLSVVHRSWRARG
ncbi:MAG: hypothetical protein AAGH15_00915, partial [Myxococcota bacterium]